jgi:glucosamine 6-phosphate synthetase-like amidotransferase/phosphosugar isomerase protein
VNPYIQELQMNFEQIEKGGYDHFMLKRYMSNLASLKILIEEVTRKQRAYSNVWS